MLQWLGHGSAGDQGNMDSMRGLGSTGQHALAQLGLWV